MDDQFRKILQKFNDEALKPALILAKQQLEQNALPADFIAQAIENAYANLGNANVPQTLDPAQLEQVIGALKSQLQSPQVSGMLAQAIQKLPADKLESAFEAISGKASFEQQLALQVVFMQLSPMIEQMQASSVDDAAKQIRDFADNIDPAMLAQLIVAMAPNPLEGKQLPQVQPEQLPPAQAVADLFSALNAEVIKALDNASNGSSIEETLASLQQFPQVAAKLLRQLEQQKGNFEAPKKPEAKKPEAPKQPKPPKKKPGGFDL